MGRPCLVLRGTSIRCPYSLGFETNVPLISILLCRSFAEDSGSIHRSFSSVDHALQYIDYLYIQLTAINDNSNLSTFFG